MIYLRRSEDRGRAAHGWFEALCTFSCAGYYNPRFQSFGSLQGLNDERLIGGAGHRTHHHREIELLTLVLSGGLREMDPRGAIHCLGPGDVSWLSAGSGAQHQETNESAVVPVWYLQLRLASDNRAGRPVYGIRSWPLEALDGWERVASGSRRPGAFPLHQDAEVFVGGFKAGVMGSYALQPNRQAWIHLIDGAMKLNNVVLEAGDGAAAIEEEQLRWRCVRESRALLIELSSRFSAPRQEDQAAVEEDRDCACSDAPASGEA